MSVSFRRAIPAAATALAVLAAPAVASAAVAGPDVSGWQHAPTASISWPAVMAGGSSFTFIKATEGTSYRNPYFASDWAGSARAGLIHGAYHFARPTTMAGSAAAQARWFVGSAGTMHRAGELPPVLDLEVSGGLTPSQLIAWTRTWLATVKTLTGRTPTVYSYPYFWRTALAGTTAFRGYPLWGASYGASPTTFGGAWSTWTFWQYTSSATTRGISGPSDMSRFNGSLAQLQAMANGAPAPAPAPAPSPRPTAPAPLPKPTVPAPPVPPTTPSVASPPPMSGVVTTRLTATAPDSANPWENFSFTGRLTTGAGSAVAGRAVRILGRMVGTTTWHPVTTVTTGPTGLWAVGLRAPASAELRAQYLGSATLTTATSPLVAVTITSDTSD